MTGRRVAVIGAGLGGLSAAARLAAAGHSVDVFESQDFPGGKAGSVRHGAYRFDTGPSLVTMPHVLNQLFAETGEARSDYINLTPLEDICRYFFSDGSTLTSFSDRERFASEIASKTGDSPEALHRFLNYSGRIYRVVSRLFLWNSLHEFGTYANLSAIRSILSAARIDPLRTMDRAVRSFFSDPRMVQFFNRYATYNGSNPYRTPATLNIIPHVEYDIGASFADDGVFSIPLGIARLAEEKGVKLHLSTPVRRILTDPVRRNVRGIDVAGEKLDYDAVVSNADVAQTYGELLQDSRARLLRRHLRQEPSSSGLVFYLGMKDSFPELGLHNIFFSSDYRSEFADIFERGMCPSDPTVYVNITSKVTPEDAPPGGENWFVLVNAPRDAGQDWQAESSRVRGAVFARLSGALGRDVRKSVEEESVMTPADIAAQTGSRSGSLYGNSSHSWLAAFLRHPNRSNRYSGLYFCGGSVHPGGGVPLVILSGKIAADLLRKDMKRGRL